MSDRSNVEAPSPAPPSPVGLTLWTTYWLAIATIAASVLIIDPDRVVMNALDGQRSSGVLVLIPGAALAAGVVCAVRAVRARSSWADYQGRWSPEQRANAEKRRLAEVGAGFSLSVGTILGAIWVAGLAAVTIFWGSLSSNPQGLSIAIVLLGLLGGAWIPLVRGGVRRHQASKWAAAARAR